MKKFKKLMLFTLLAAMFLVTTIISCSKETENAVNLKGQSSNSSNQQVNEDSSPEGGVTLGDIIYIDDPESGDSITMWNSNTEDEGYIYFTHPSYDTYYLRYNKVTEEFESDLPERDYVKCWCEYCDFPGTFNWVWCWSVDNCNDCCDKLCAQYPAPPTE